MNRRVNPNFSMMQQSIADDEIEISQIFGVLRDERKIILGTILIAFAIGVLYAFLSTPIYKADALLQVEPKSSGMPGLADLTGAFEFDSEAITEIEVLKSRMVLEQVVDDLKLNTFIEPNYFPLIGRGLSNMLSNETRKSVSNVFPSYAWGGEYVLVSKLEVQDNLLGEELCLVVKENSGYELYHDGKLLVSGKVGNISKVSDLIILISDITDRPGLRFTLKRITKLRAIRDLQEKLAVDEKGRNSGVLSVSQTGSNAEQTRRTLDSITKKYLLQNVKRMSAEAEKSLEFLQDQLPDIKKKLMTSEYTLNSYRLKNESIDLTLETKSILESVVEIEEQLNELALEETKLKKLFTPEHPNYASLIEKRRMLTTEKEKLQSKIKDLPVTQQQILRLTRDVEVNQSIYVEMLNKMQELAIVKAGTIGNVRILDSAELLEEPIKPKRSLIVFISIFLGLVIGIISAFVRVAMRRGVKSADELEALGLPVYATVPLSDTQQKITKGLRVSILSPSKTKKESTNSLLLADIDPEDVAIEALRSLRTSMHFAMLETTNNILMITGPGQDLGKSFVSANLAAVYAHAGQKVLVIDCDLRKGHMHRLFNMGREHGLSELLSGQSEKESSIRKTEIEGLHFVPCGVVPPNPAEILLHKNLKDFLNWASSNYDIVIVDTPPVLAVTDANIIGGYAGVTMFVARFEQTHSKEIETALKRCEQGGIIVKGCILNGIVPRYSGSYVYGNYKYMQNKYS